MPGSAAANANGQHPFSPVEAERTLQQHYGLSSLDGLGLPEHPLALQALGGLLRYLKDTQPLEDDSRIPLEVPAIVHRGDVMVLDAQTRRNLELTATQRDNHLQGLLLWRSIAPLPPWAADAYAAGWKHR